MLYKRNIGHFKCGSILVLTRPPLSFQRPKSRHEELKERARLILEQARKEAASKAQTLTRPTDNDIKRQPVASSTQPVSEVGRDISVGWGW